MRNFLLAFVIAVLFVGAAAAAHAHATENALFTCAGELIRFRGNDHKTFYDIVESWKEEMPMDCDIGDTLESL
jgi:opacity protein-like surface antigen